MVVLAGPDKLFKYEIRTCRLAVKYFTVIMQTFWWVVLGLETRCLSCGIPGIFEYRIKRHNEIILNKFWFVLQTYNVVFVPSNHIH